MTQPTLAVIGGSGLYELASLENTKEHRVATPFGEPSEAIVEGQLGETRLLFLSRHGRGHRLLPSEVNARANIFALKSLGATAVLSVSAVGSMREDIAPGDMVVVSQFIDRTKGRASTFFGSGIVGHVMFADPVCPHLSNAAHEACRALGLRVHAGKTLMVMEGPAFSTRAESLLHRAMGVDLIGMTAMPEAKLAREAELCYATLALATDYDCWHETEEDVSVDAVVKILKQNAHSARRIVETLAKAIPTLPRDCPCPCALDFAIITDRSVLPAQRAASLRPIFGRVL
ncbi:MAG: S-methyl-5'-thioadenosine phosphorylase [Myxococcota bacterium]|jgi:5'-methylthioadenosine phosphorylase|nr:S-methyl-5'-thioadenosine phosphorylase [Myxococcota bacterium]